jgi:hypothetical protein
LNFNDVSLFQKLLPAEVRAMANGRQLFPYPPGTDRPDRTPPPQAA